MSATKPKAARWHWTMAMLLVAVYAAMEFDDAFSAGEEAVKARLYALGLCVLALVAVRTAVRTDGPVPPIHSQPPAWQRLLARLTRLALYLFVIAMSLLGWMAFSREGKTARLPGLGWAVPPPPGVDESLGETAEEPHVAVAVRGHWLIGLHTAAALVRHYPRPRRRAAPHVAAPASRMSTHSFPNLRWRIA